MNATRPYYLIGRRQLDRLEERVRHVLTPLGERWWPAGDVLQAVGIGNFCGEELVGSKARYFVERDDTWLALFGPERGWLALAEGWLGCSVAAGSELVQTLTRAFCSEMFNALRGSEQIADVRSDLSWAQLPSNLLQPGAGTLLLNITIGGVELKLLASATLWPDLAVPSVVRSSKEIVPCHAALNACRVDVSAMLPVAQVSLTDIATLAVGDFLNLGHDLSGQVQLRGENISLTLPAIIGRDRLSKAIRLTAIRNEKSA